MIDHTVQYTISSPNRQKGVSDIFGQNYFCIIKSSEKSALLTGIKV